MLSTRPQCISGVDAKFASRGSAPRATRVAHRGQNRLGGFTLIEILIVVVILGILAAIVLPQFTSAADESRTNSLKMTLFRVRTQIEIYYQQHGAYPSLATLEDQLTLASNDAGDTAAIGTSGYKLGPYLQEFPLNPETGTNTVSAGAVGTSAWYYDETTGELKANNSTEARAY